ncbi:hypothetical protein [Micromonospora mirobrigensis]|uniref:Uncharacterized protein n=1 Tax=Micromonospora mirobrigensis TaxID=262898 RepID=A0A1C4ZSL6_9ACTN|nr:hypothetical protein [Micromonospora mirobrigensis]SCF35922.1 hypothetical protein GA0070564_106264 [Micromonospora mirobrigensis]
MRGDLDETLARLARRQEALRRRGDPDDAARPDDGPTEEVRPAIARPNAGPRAVGPREAALWDVGGPDVGGPDVGGPDVGGSVAGLAEARGTRSGRHEAGPDPVEEVAEAVRRVLAAYPDVTVTLRVEHAGRTYPLRIAPSDGDVSVRADPPAPPPVWPLTGPASPGWESHREAADPAARLADLIRRDPSLLDGTAPDH